MASLRSGAALGRVAYRQSLFTAPRPRFRQDALSRRCFSQQPPKRPRFSSRLRTALKNSHIQWYQIPVGLGIGFLGVVQFYKVTRREREKQEQESQDREAATRPQKRPRIRPNGPWYVCMRVRLVSRPSLLLTEWQASPGHVDVALEGAVTALG